MALLDVFEVDVLPTDLFQQLEGDAEELVVALRGIHVCHDQVCERAGVGNLPQLVVHLSAACYLVSCFLVKFGASTRLLNSLAVSLFPAALLFHSTNLGWGLALPCVILVSLRILLALFDVFADLLLAPLTATLGRLRHLCKQF